MPVNVFLRKLFSKYLVHIDKMKISNLGVFSKFNLQKYRSVEIFHETISSTIIYNFEDNMFISQYFISLPWDYSCFWINTSCTYLKKYFQFKNVFFVIFNYFPAKISHHGFDSQFGCEFPMIFTLIPIQSLLNNNVTFITSCNWWFDYSI